LCGYPHNLTARLLADELVECVDENDEESRFENVKLDNVESQGLKVGNEAGYHGSLLLFGLAVYALSKSSEANKRMVASA
jgi:hypothetical protein